MATSRKVRDIALAVSMIGVLATTQNAGAETYVIENEALLFHTNDITVAGWSHDATTLFYNESGSLKQYDFATQTISTLLSAGSLGAGTGAGLSPDGEWLMFFSAAGGLSRRHLVTPFEVEEDMLTSAQLTGAGGTLTLAAPTRLPNGGAKLTVAVKNGSALEGIYVLDVSNQGVPVLPVAPATGKVVGSSSESGWDTLDFVPNLSPTGDSLLIQAQRDCPADATADVFAVTGVSAILAGSSPVITSSSDVGVFPIGRDDRFTNPAVWSSDGSLIYYGEDSLGNVDLCSPMSPELWDMDIAVVDLDAVIGGSPEGTFIPNGPGFQIYGLPSPGGTRFVFGTLLFTGGGGTDITVATLRVSETVPLNASAETTTAFELNDGSGTKLTVPIGTQIGNHGVTLPGNLTISAFTPLTPVTFTPEQGVVAVRNFDPDGLTFDSSPATLTMHYSAAEVDDIVESSLTANEYNTATLMWDIQLATVQDEALNTLTADINGFSEFGASGIPLPRAVQTKAQQKCINALNKAGAKVAATQGKENAACVKNGGSGQEPDPQACLTADAKGKVDKAQSKTIAALAKQCAVQLPLFGPSDAGVVNAAATDEEVSLVANVFGADLNFAIISAAADKPGAQCQAAVAKEYEKLLAKKAKAFLKCKKSGLKGKSTEPFDSFIALETCFDSVQADAKIAGAIVKFGEQVDAKCVGVDFDSTFPGDCIGAGDFSTCVNERIDCRLCRMLNAMDDLGRDCDTYDDATANVSCP